MTEDAEARLIDAKIALSEATFETKVVRLEGKLDSLTTSISELGTKIDAQRTDAASNRNIILATVVGAALSLAALLFGALSYGASTFYNGTVVRDIVHNEMSAQTQRPADLSK